MTKTAPETAAPETAVTDPVATIDKKRKRAPSKGPKPVRRPRGPPRPHRKLPQETLDSRITKLQNRIDRSKAQMEDAERHIDGYLKEAGYRKTDPPATAEAPAAACPN